MADLQAPFLWFGGKSRVADRVWERFGDVPNYVEPFFGSGACILGRPHQPKAETVNDIDGFLANFWRAIALDPDAVAHWADWPVNECDLHARHAWLVSQRETLTARLMGDADFFDAKIAGYWVWGICSWIGSGWCRGSGPWIVQDGMLIDRRNLPHLDEGQGINRKLPHLGDAGRGINRKLPHLGNAGQGINRKTDLTRGEFIREWFRDLSDRLRNVRVACGDWKRVMGESVTTKLGLTAVFLDPPYADTAKRCSNLYACDSLSVARQVREWAIANGDNPKLRIALCGYEGEHTMPEAWECMPWAALGGYGSQAKVASGNFKRERIWFSPHCLKAETEPSTMFRDAV